MPARNLDSIPVETMAQITSYLRPSAIARMHLVSEGVHNITVPAPPLSPASFYRFHHEFEASARLKTPIKLVCRSCLQLLEPDRYQDSQAKRRCDKMSGRVCFACGVLDGTYNVRNFSYRKENCFSCFGCPEPKKVEEEAQYASPEPRLQSFNVVWRPDRGTKRWCKKCWSTVMMFANKRLAA